MWKGSSLWVEEAWALGSVSGESPSTGGAAMQHQRALSTVWMGWDIHWRYTNTPVSLSIDLLINPSQVSSQPFAFIQMQIYCYNPDDFHSLDDAVREGGRIAALAVLFEVGWPVNLQPEVSDQTDPPLWLFKWDFWKRLGLYKAHTLSCRSAGKTTRTSILLLMLSTLSAGLVSINYWVERRVYPLKRQVGVFNGIFEIKNNNHVMFGFCVLVNRNK